MTSKISFAKVCKENRKQNLAEILLSVLVMVGGIIYTIIQVEKWISWCKNNDGVVVQKYLDSYISASSLRAGYVVAIAIALIWGVFAFHFIHDKRQLDLFESIPIKRKTRFWAITTNAFALALIGILLINIFTAIFLAAVHALSTKAFLNIALATVLAIFLFVSVYATSVISMLLTGNTLMGIMLNIAINLYCPLVIRGFFPYMAGKNFETYVTGGDYKILNALSPLGQYADIIRYRVYDESDLAWNFKDSIPSIIVALIYVVVLCVISYILFNKRHTEDAGAPIVYKATYAPIRMLLIIPIAVYFGQFLRSTSDDMSKIWVYIGILIAAIVCHGLMQSIFERDIKAFIHCKIQFVATAIIAAAIALIFTNDLMGYDKWIPKSEDVADLKIYFANSMYDEYYFWGEKSGYEDMKPEILSLVEKTIEQNEIRTANPKAVDTDERVYMSVELTYEMKNGKQKQRSYLVPFDEIADGANTIFTDIRYKDDYFSVYTFDASKITDIEFTNRVQTDKVHLTDDEKTEFFELYKKEFLSVSLSDYYDVPPVGRIDITHKNVATDSYDVSTTDYYYIYANMPETIDFLESRGFDCCNYVGEKYDILYGTASVYVEPNSDDPDAAGEWIDYVFNDYDILSRYGMLFRTNIVDETGYTGSYKDVSFVLTLEKDGMTYEVGCYIDKEYYDEFMAACGNEYQDQTDDAVSNDTDETAGDLADEDVNYIEVRKYY